MTDCSTDTSPAPSPDATGSLSEGGTHEFTATISKVETFYLKVRVEIPSGLTYDEVRALLEDEWDSAVTDADCYSPARDKDVLSAKSEEYTEGNGGVRQIRFVHPETGLVERLSIGFSQ